MIEGDTRDIVVIGGSAGSGAVLRQLVAELPEDLPAAIFISTHMPALVANNLCEVLASRARMPVRVAIDAQPVERGHITVAAPDRHLLLIGGVVRLGEGPRENMARPAIDPLFRSAALAFGPRVIGVVLTGMLNDGAAGLASIASCGGCAVVQSPTDAEAEQMPLAALESAKVDHVVPASGLAGLLTVLAGARVEGHHHASERLRLEVGIAAGRRLGSDALRRIATPSPLSCPECNGVLSEIDDSPPLRYRCQIGHGFTAEVLAAHSDEVDEAVQVAMRIMEERVTLVERMARDARDGGRSAVAELYETRAAEYRGYAATLRTAASASLRMGRTAGGEQP